MQNIPAKEKSIRMMFMATKKEFEIECNENCYNLTRWDKVETNRGTVFAKDLVVNDKLITNEGVDIVSNVNVEEDNVIVFVKEGG